MAVGENQTLLQDSTRLAALKALDWARRSSANSPGSRDRSPRVVTVRAADWTYHVCTVSADRAQLILGSPSTIERFAARLSDRFHFNFSQVCQLLRESLSAEVQRRASSISSSDGPLVLLGLCDGTPLVLERELVSGMAVSRVGVTDAGGEIEARLWRALQRYNPFTPWMHDGLVLHAVSQNFLQSFEKSGAKLGRSFALTVGDVDTSTRLSSLHGFTDSLIASRDPVTGREWTGSAAPSMIAVVAWPNSDFEGYSEFLVSIDVATGLPMGLQAAEFSSLEHDRGFKPWIEGPVKDAVDRYGSVLAGDVLDDRRRVSIEIDERRERFVRKKSAGATAGGAQVVLLDEELALPRGSVLDKLMDRDSHHEVLPEDVTDTSSSGQDDAQTFDALIELKQLAAQLGVIHTRYASRLQKIFDECAGEKLKSPEDAVEFRELVNNLLDRLDRRLRLPDGDEGRLNTAPNHQGLYRIRFNRSSGSTVSSGAKPQVIPHGLRLTR